MSTALRLDDWFVRDLQGDVILVEGFIFEFPVLQGEECELCK